MTNVGTRLPATIDDVEVAGKRVLLRVDFNVPMRDGRIVDDRRIRVALPTIKALSKRGARVLVCTHLGRPKHGPEAAFSTRPLAAHLALLLDAEVGFAADVVGGEAEALSHKLRDGEVGMLENVRFEAGETANSGELAGKLARLADIYCDDAFGAAHRAHASTEGVAHRIPAVAGYLMARELDVLGGVFANPARPVVGVIGGAKISTKLGVITNLLDKVDILWIGGAMACTFYRALGETTGTSLVEADQIAVAGPLFHEAQRHRADLRLPVDLVVAASAEKGAPTRVVSWHEIPDDMMVVDVGPETVRQMSATCYGAGTVIWNGPLGIYEIDDFAVGTRKLAEAIARSDAMSVIGGGDLAAAVETAGVADKIGHISTGGGATLEFMEGKTLPGVAVLRGDS